MSIRIKNPGKLAQIATIATLTFTIGTGLWMSATEIKPFWVDEWRIMYNLKFKDAGQLWGKLEYMQQFPRVYLQLIKYFTSLFDYNYISLRVPSYIVGTLMILLSYRLMNKIYPRLHINKFLFVLIMVSGCTFTDYYVQIKQYTMDLLLCFVALWQFLELLRWQDGKESPLSRYVLLCASFIIAPFFSYTYPLTVVPVFIIQFAWTIRILLNPNGPTRKVFVLLRQLFPLLLCASSIYVFYKIDVSQLMADKEMHNYWGHLMMDNGFKVNIFFYGFYNLFAEVGAGMLYWYLFGIIGMLSFLAGIYTCSVNIRSNRNTVGDLVLLYSTLLIIVMILLFVAGKYPLGEPRLNAIAIPAISVLIIHALDQLTMYTTTRRLSGWLSFVFFAGVAGNIYTSFYANTMGTTPLKQLAIYRATEQAIELAQAKKIPILVTSGVAWPHDKTRNYPFTNTIPGDWVLKSFPAYHVADSIPVYPIKDMTMVQEEMKQLPPGVTSVVAGNGETFQIITR